MGYSNIEKIEIKNNREIPSVKEIKSDKSINISFKNYTSNNVEAFCKKYKITPEQYNLLIQKYDGLSELQDINKITNIVNKEFSKSEDVTTEAPVSGVVYSETNVDKSISEQTFFNHKEFAALSNEEKVNIYAQELAKNKFIYNADGEKSLDEWNALSEQEKQNLINVELKSVVKESSDGKFDDKTISDIFQYKMTSLQSANYFEENIDNFNKRPEEQKQEIFHDYIFNLGKDNLSEGQQKYLKVQKSITEAVVAACRKNGVDLGDGDYNMSPAEIKQLLEQLGTNSVKVRIDYLSDLEKNGSVLSKEEKDKLAQLKQMESFANEVGQLPNKSYGRMEALNNSSYGELWNSASEPADKFNILKMYIKNEYANLSPEDKHRAVTELLSEIAPDDAETSLLVHEYVVSGASKEEQNAYVKDGSCTVQLLNSYNVNAFGDDAAINLAQKQQEISNENHELGCELALISLKNADETHLATTSNVYAGFGDKGVEDAHVNAALDKNRVSAETQRIMLLNTAALSNTETKIAASIRLDEAYTENQLPLTETFIKDKDCNDAMIENGTFTRFADENQVDAFKMQKIRCEQSDYDKDDAINKLNTLSDWISECKNSDNQLAMHNEIMTSQYSQVVEHAAGNIEKYNADVQEAAIESVYATGSQKAIETAITNLCQSSNYANNVQTAVLKPILETAVDTANDDTLAAIKEKISSGQTVTLSEWNQLSASEKLQYKAAYFKSLSPAKQIALLAGITDKSLKVYLYNRIANTNSAMLNSIIESSADTARFVYDNVPAGRETVRQVAERKCHSQNNFASLYKNIQKEIEEKEMKEDTQDKYPPTAHTVRYASLPEGLGSFDSKYIYPKDKNGFSIA